MSSSQSRIIPVEGIIKNYSWGSHSVLAAHHGQEASVEPEAELWFGDHPQGPAKVLNSEDTLEKFTVEFGSLPFLAKILAVEHSLSLQVHPALADIPALMNVRKDANHKPEMVIALTRFEALVGFAPTAVTLELLASFELPEINRLLAEPIIQGASYSELLEQLLGVDDSEGTLDLVLTRLDRIDAVRAKWLRELIELYAPKLDPLATLLCELVILEPGECLYLPPRCIHAYLNGIVIEVMANSDNVIRGGLTHKPIDKRNFLAIIDAATEGAERIEPAISDGVRTWTPPISDFSVREFYGDIQSTFQLSDHAIAFTWQGSSVVSSSDDVNAPKGIEVSKRNGALLAPGSYEVTGKGSLWLATGKRR